ncbi:MAG: glycosyl transferase [Bacteroidota bacterium]
MEKSLIAMVFWLKLPVSRSVIHRDDMIAGENNILIITYYWPPSGGSGVQRWLKFVKYLPAHGFTPYVFTPENPDFQLRDPSLLNDVPAEAEVIHFPIWEPYRLLEGIKKIAGKTSSGGASNAGKEPSGFMAWVRGNFFIPDPRVFWVKPSVAFLKDFIRDRHIQTIITTGPPHSVHLIGLRLKQSHPRLKWIADFRDPWTTWGALKKFRLTAPALARHRRLEQQVLTTADEVLTISPFYQRQLEQLSGRSVRLFTNGYDDEDFSGMVLQQGERFTIRHAGILHPECDAGPFLEAFADWIKSRNLAGQVRLVFTGQVHARFREQVAGDPVLSKIVEVEPPVDHREIIRLYGQSAALLLILTGYRDAEGFLPGKLYEYLATGLPVIAEGPTVGDAATLLQQSGAGEMKDSADHAGIQASLDKAFTDWQYHTKHTVLPERVNPWSRRSVTAALAQLLHSLVS